MRRTTQVEPFPSVRPPAFRTASDVAAYSLVACASLQRVPRSVRRAALRHALAECVCRLMSKQSVGGRLGGDMRQVPGEVGHVEASERIERRGVVQALDERAQLWRLA